MTNIKKLTLVWLLTILLNFSAVASLTSDLDEVESSSTPKVVSTSSDEEGEGESSSSSISLKFAWDNYGGITPGTIFQKTWLHTWTEAKKEFGTGSAYRLVEYLNKDTTRRIPYIETWFTAPSEKGELSFVASLFANKFKELTRGSSCLTGIQIDEFALPDSLGSAYIEKNPWGRFSSDMQDFARKKRRRPPVRPTSQ